MQENVVLAKMGAVCVTGGQVSAPRAPRLERLKRSLGSGQSCTWQTWLHCQGCLQGRDAESQPGMGLLSFPLSAGNVDY
jgi:hypothetical protein